jgi:hypothetical protein
MVEHTITFGGLGNAAQYQRAGWSHPEDGFTWSAGLFSVLELPTPAAPRELELHLRPFVAPALPGQTLIVSANNHRIGEVFLTDETILSFPLQATIVTSPTLRIAFQQPDATIAAIAGAGGDMRRLAFAVRRLTLRPAHPPQAFVPVARPPLPATTLADVHQYARGCTGLPLHKFALSFESIGHNCEFGLVQRFFGAEPLGLLRFAGIKPPALLSGLRTGFENLTDPGNLYVRPLNNCPDSEWLACDHTYGIETHTWQSGADFTAATVLRQAQRRFKFLRRKFIETRLLANRILVFQHPRIHHEAIIRPIAAAVAPSMLLWVSQSAAAPPGTVHHIAPNILHGFIDKLAPEGEAGSTNQLAWASIMANAYRLWRWAGFSDV